MHKSEALNKTYCKANTTSSVSMKTNAKSATKYYSGLPSHTQQAFTPQSETNNMHLHPVSFTAQSPIKELCNLSQGVLQNCFRMCMNKHTGLCISSKRITLHAWAHILILSSLQVLLNKGNLSEGSCSYNRKKYFSFIWVMEATRQIHSMLEIDQVEELL